MEPRLPIGHLIPKPLMLMQEVEAEIAQSCLEPALLHLVKMRASQINGCAYCLDMHSKDARAEGESEQRLYALDAWDETPFFTDRERAALLWTEAVTRVSENHVPASVYEAVRGEFTDQELAYLTLAAATINAWNRLNVALRTVPGEYRPGMFRRLREGPSQQGARTAATSPR
ncbi:MAG: carboxymuconolactone decarboxylase family protein [Steroidobacteraceae bacterium]